MGEGGLASRALPMRSRAGRVRTAVQVKLSMRRAGPSPQERFTLIQASSEISKTFGPPLWHFEARFFLPCPENYNLPLVNDWPVVDECSL